MQSSGSRGGKFGSPMACLFISFCFSSCLTQLGWQWQRFCFLLTKINCSSCSFSLTNVSEISPQSNLSLWVLRLQQKFASGWVFWSCSSRNMFILWKWFWRDLLWFEALYMTMEQSRQRKCRHNYGRFVSLSYVWRNMVGHRWFTCTVVFLSELSILMATSDSPFSSKILWGPVNLGELLEFLPAK